MSDTIKLVSSVGEVFEVNPAFAKLSKFVGDKIKRYGEKTPVRLPSSSSVIQKMIEYASYYNFDPPNQEADDEKPVVISPWDIEFMKNVSVILVFGIVYVNH